MTEDLRQFADQCRRKMVASTQPEKNPGNTENTVGAELLPSKINETVVKIDVEASDKCALCDFRPQDKDYELLRSHVSLNHFTGGR